MSFGSVIKRLRSVFGCLVLLATVGTQAGATTNVVRTLADGGAASLRQAIADASPGDTITFSTNGTITLTNGELFIGKSLVILGPSAASLAVSGNGASRVFNFSVGLTATISGITIRDGRAPDAPEAGASARGNGGGIYNLGVLTLNGCVITANHTGNGTSGTNGTRGTDGN